MMTETEMTGLTDPTESTGANGIHEALRRGIVSAMLLNDRYERLVSVCVFPCTGGVSTRSSDRRGYRAIVWSTFWRTVLTVRRGSTTRHWGRGRGYRQACASSRRPEQAGAGRQAQERTAGPWSSQSIEARTVEQQLEPQSQSASLRQSGTGT